VPLAKNTAVRHAVKLYRDFTGMEPQYIDTYSVPEIKIATLIGHCDGVKYTTVRDGRTEKYVHTFKNASRPLLAVSFDGKQLIMLGGAYQFTERGIVDS
jgi:hypothetical protein